VYLNTDYSILFSVTYGLFNDAISNSDHIASNYRIINEYGTGRDLEGGG
jgi:hypothetical protein